MGFSKGKNYTGIKYSNIASYEPRSKGSTKDFKRLSTIKFMYDTPTLFECFAYSNIELQSLYVFFTGYIKSHYPFKDYLDEVLESEC